MTFRRRYEAHGAQETAAAFPGDPSRRWSRGTPATEQNDFAITQGNQSVLEPEGLKAIKKIGKNRKDKDKTRQFTFTEYEVGISSTRGRPLKYGKGDEGDGSRKQGIPRC